MKHRYRRAARGDLRARHRRRLPADPQRTHRTDPAGHAGLDL